MAAPLRSAGLAVIRVLGLLVGAVAAAYGVSQMILAVLAPQIDVPGLPYGLLVLPLEVRVVVGLGTLVGSLTVSVVALAVSRLAARVRREPGFVHETTIAVRIAGVALIAGSLGAQILTNVGRELAVQAGSDGSGSFAWFVIPDLSLAGVGVALLLVAGILRHGERLQRDTEGLV